MPDLDLEFTHVQRCPTCGRDVAAEAPARPADAPATADWMTEFERKMDD